MRPWIHKAATSAMVTVIAGGGMAATAIIQGHVGRPHAGQSAPAQAQGGHSPAPSTSVSPEPSAGRSVAHSAPPSASVSPVVALRFSPATAALAGGAGGSAPGGSPGTVPSSPPPGPSPGPTPAPSPGRSPSCTVNVALGHLDVCAGINITAKGN